MAAIKNKIFTLLELSNILVERKVLKNGEFVQKFDDMFDYSFMRDILHTADKRPFNYTGEGSFANIEGDTIIYFDILNKDFVDRLNSIEDICEFEEAEFLDIEVKVTGV